MFSIYVYSLLSVMMVSLVSLMGIFTLSMKEGVLKKYVFLLVSLAVGALLGDAFIHLIPESFESIGNGIGVSLAIILGILIFFILEKFLHWHHHQTDSDDSEIKEIHPVGHMILISDGVHNIIDGFIIGVSYLVSIEVGIATTIAVLLHEIPQEISDFGILLHAGYSRVRALWLNFLSALLAILGALAALLIGGSAEEFTMWLIPIAAGGFIYVAMSDLIPEMHKTKHAKYSALQVVMVLIGVAFMLALLSLE